MDVQPEISPWTPELYGHSFSGEKWQLVRRNKAFFRSQEVLVGKGGDSRCFRSEIAVQKVADTLNDAERAAQAAKQGAPNGQ
jgi:hypothetical protein